MAQHDSELMAQQQQSALRYSKRSTQSKLTILLSIAKLLYYSNFKAGNGLATGSFEKAVTKQGVRTQQQDGSIATMAAGLLKN